MIETERRLDALAGYGILDTPAEPEFDDIVHIAQRVCETPIALVSLVAEHRQWFKAAAGLTVCETPIDRSICKYALDSDDILVIADLTADPRTKSNPLVTGEPYIRFYAGAVLRTPEDVAIGTVCVVDTQPRPRGLTQGQTETLKALARQVMILLSMRRAMSVGKAALAAERESGLGWVTRAKASEAISARLRAEEMRLSEAQQAGGVGTFDIDVAVDRCRVSAEFCRIFGLPVARSYSPGEIQSLVVKDDRRFITSTEDRSDGSAQRDVEFRIRRASDGALRWIGRRADFRHDAEGNVQTMVGIVQDITDRKLSERRSQALIALGDRLRVAATVAEAVDIGTRVLGETLGTGRTAYAAIDLAAATIRIDHDWTAEGVKSIAGTYPTAMFGRTIERLKEGAPITLANVPAAAWLGGDLAAYSAIEARAQMKVPLMRRGELVGVFLAQSGTPRSWSASEERFAIAVADRTYAAIAKIEAEVQQRFLNDELSHRLKNMLAMVQAIVAQSLRGIGERDVARSLEERIIALSKAHDVLLQESWTSARIHKVIEEVLGPHGPSESFRILGPNLILGPKAALSLSLLLHELATNATKYGALSVSGGHVELAWRVEGHTTAPAFVMAWIETGGPPAKAPTRRGFGSRLIAMGIAGTGKTKLDYGGQGLRAEFHSPLRAVTEL